MSFSMAAFSEKLFQILQQLTLSILVKELPFLFLFRLIFQMKYTLRNGGIESSIQKEEKNRWKTVQLNS